MVEWSAVLVTCPVKVEDQRKLHLQNFAVNPTIDADGTIDTDSIVCTQETLDAAHDAAERIVAMLERLPLTEGAIDVMNIAFSVLHYHNKGI